MTDFGVKKAAKTLVRAVKGEVTFEALERYIEGFGYSVILYSENDSYVTKYDVAEYASSKFAFTYSGAVKIIFIRKSAHAYDKLRLLLSQIGRVVLGDMENGHLRTADKIEMEFRADYFAHLVLDLAARKKYRWRLFG